MREELDRAENHGLKRFLISLYQIVYRVQQVWEGSKEGFSRTVEKARPVLEDLKAVFSELGREIGGLFSRLTGGAAALPSSEFRSFGQAAGAAIATVVAWLTQLVAALTRVTTGVIGGFRSMKEYVGPAFELVGEALGRLLDAWNAPTGGSKDSMKASNESTSVAVPRRVPRAGVRGRRNTQRWRLPASSRWSPRPSGWSTPRRTRSSPPAPG